MNAKAEQQVSSGVEALIERLRQEGVQQGRKEAEQIVEDARQQAKNLIISAKTEAEAIVREARADAKRMETSGREALHIAARDTILDMKATLMQRFTSDVERLISAEMNEKTLIQKLVLEIVQHTREDVDIKDDEDMEVILPRDVVGLEDLRRRPEKFEQDTLTHFVRSLTGGMLRKGIVFKASEDISAGIRVRLTDRNIEIDLTDESVATLLLEHLQPRFRAMLEGIVK